MKHVIWLVWMTSITNREPEWLGGFGSKDDAAMYVEQEKKLWQGRIPHIIQMYVADEVWEELRRIETFFLAPNRSQDIKK